MKKLLLLFTILSASLFFYSCGDGAEKTGEACCMSKDKKEACDVKKDSTSCHAKKEACKENEDCKADKCCHEHKEDCKGECKHKCQKGEEATNTESDSSEETETPEATQE